jgi:hypothetical protein
VLFSVLEVQRATKKREKEGKQALAAPPQIADEILSLTKKLADADLNPALRKVHRAALSEAITQLQSSTTSGPVAEQVQGLLKKLKDEVDRMSVCSDREKKADCFTARDRALELLDQVAPREGDKFEVILPCSRAQLDSRLVLTDPATARPSAVKDFAAYFVEVRNILGELPKKQLGRLQRSKECRPKLFEGVTLNWDDVRELTRLVEGTLGELGINPRVAALLQPAIAFDKELKTQTPSALVRFESRSWGPVRFGGSFGLAPAVVIQKTAPGELTITETTTRTNGQSTYQSVQSGTGSFTQNCDPTKTPPCKPEPGKSETTLPRSCWITSSVGQATPGSRRSPAFWCKATSIS